MSLNESIQRAENVLRESLLEQQEGVDDRTGKGTSAEMLIEERLIFESALSVHAAMAGGSMGHYSRRMRPITSAERFPAGVAGRLDGRHARDAQLGCWT